MDKITDLNDVQTFVIASRTGSLSAAALELGKPTSTVSRALTRLEKDLGVLLMRRGSRGLTLTDDGEGYLSACKRALRSLHEGGLGLNVRQSNPSGLLKIACPVTFNKAIEELSRLYNPMIRGWLQYYARFYRTALRSIVRQLDRELVLWAKRKYKKLRAHVRRARHWIASISRRCPELFAHWELARSVAP